MISRRRLAGVLALVSAAFVIGPGVASAASTPGGAVRAPAIVGGTVAAPGAWPWMARIDLETPDGILFPTMDGQPDVGLWCGGTLIGERWVLTAGHCTLLFGEVIGGPGFIPGISFRLVIGETQLNGVLDTANEFRIAPEDVIALHPAPGGGMSGDLALVRLPRAATNEALRIVGASNDRRVSLEPGAPLMATGWGALSESDPALPLELRQVELPLVSDRDCGFAYPTIEDEWGIYGFNANTMVCAGLAGKDTCFGDSGGPLMAPDGAGGWVQVGITSWGEGCARSGYPGVYGRLSGLYGFILSTLKADRVAPAGAPEATTRPATQVKRTTARLSGIVLPNGLATAYVIDYGTNRRYLGGHIQGYAGDGSGDALVATTVRGLKPGTTYHVRVRALNLAGSADGADLTFTTKPKPAPRRHR